MIGVVYFLSDGCGLIKVGHTKSPDFRFHQLEIQEKKSLSLIGTIDGDYQTENRVHRLLSEWRRRGRDWFEDCAEVRSAIAEYIEVGVPPDENPDSEINQRCGRRQRHSLRILSARAIPKWSPTRLSRERSASVAIGCARTSEGMVSHFFRSALQCFNSPKIWWIQRRARIAAQRRAKIRLEMLGHHKFPQ